MSIIQNSSFSLYFQHGPNNLVLKYNMGEMLARDKHSSLSGPFVIYKVNEVLSIWLQRPEGLKPGTKVRCSKMVNSGLNFKCQTGQEKTLFRTNSLAYFLSTSMK